MCTKYLKEKKKNRIIFFSLTLDDPRRQNEDSIDRTQEKGGTQPSYNATTESHWAFCCRWACSWVGQRYTMMMMMMMKTKGNVSTEQRQNKHQTKGDWKPTFSFYFFTSSSFSNTFYTSFIIPQSHPQQSHKKFSITTKFII